MNAWVDNFINDVTSWNTKNRHKIKPCPLDRGAAYFGIKSGDSFHIACIKCGLSLEMGWPEELKEGETVMDYTGKRLMKKWNKRIKND